MATTKFSTIVGQAQVVPVIGEWTSAGWTPTIGNLPNTALSVRWRQVGDSFEGALQLDPNGAATGTITIPLPAGLVIDTAKLTGTSTQNTPLGYAFARPVNGASAAVCVGAVVYSSTTAVAVFGNDTSTYPGAGGAWNAATPATWAATGDVFMLRFTVPIVGWSANVAQGAGLATASRPGLVSEEQSGSFTVNLTGPFSTSMVVRYSKVGKNVVLNVPAISGTSTSATGFTWDMTNFPSAIRAAGTHYMSVISVTNSGAAQSTPGTLQLAPVAPYVIYLNASNASFAASGTCGWSQFSLAYLIP